MNLKKTLTFKDVLLVPQYSEVMSRSDVSTEVQIGSYIFNSPMIVANMKTLVGESMLLACANSRSLCFMHRFTSFDDQLQVLLKTKSKYEYAFKYVGASVGIKDVDKENVTKFFDNGIRLFCIDIAHGDSKMCIDMVKWIKDNYPDTLLVAGNVATGSGAERLWSAGADVVKCGVGSGSICSTRLMAGTGVPQLSAIIDVAKSKKQYEKKSGKNVYFISDGGCSIPADVVKALCFADMVMAGNMFAGSEDTPGDVITVGGVKEKAYNGSSTHGDKYVEGFMGAVPVKQKYSVLLENIMQGVRSGCSYHGVDNLIDLKENPQFVEISAASVVESGAHDIKVG